MSDTSIRKVRRSADDIRAWIVAELSRSMRVEPKAIDTFAPLDSLGVDSLTAVGMTGGLSAWLNCDLPATLMWDYPSIDAICKGLGSDEIAQWPGIVTFQACGEQPPLFFFPGIGGHPITFTHLTKHLGDTQPCYGLIVPGLDGKDSALTRVEDIAATMVRNLRRVQPRGPYRLIGYSFGGFLAYEAAQQLLAAGETVSKLVIYDTFTSDGRVSRPLWQRLALHAHVLATRPGRRQYFRDRLRNVLKPSASEMANLQWPSNNQEKLDDPATQIVLAANRLAAWQYRPAAYPGSIIFYRARELADYNRFFKLDPTGGWGRVARGGVEIIPMPGSHLTMLDAPYAAAAGAILSTDI